jgi:lipopolysaccharide heptosyltransferase II
LSNNPHISNIIKFDKSGGFKALKKLKFEIRKKKYDYIFDLHVNLRSLYLRINSGALVISRIHKYIFKRFLLVTLGINLYRNITPVIERYFTVARKIRLHNDQQGSEVFFPDHITIEAKQILYESGHTKGQLIIVICPGAAHATKRWLPEGFVSVANYFIHQHNAFIVLLGGEKDFDICDRIYRQTAGPAVNLAGKYNLQGAAGILKEANLVFSNDSGLLHLAQAQKKPVVAIYGCTTRELGFFPIPFRSRAVEIYLSCRPCTQKGLKKCPKGHFRCMKNIQAETVINAGEDLLKEVFLKNE